MVSKAVNILRAQRAHRIQIHGLADALRGIFRQLDDVQYEVEVFETWDGEFWVLLGAPDFRHRVWLTEAELKQLATAPADQLRDLEIPIGKDHGVPEDVLEAARETLREVYGVEVEPFGPVSTECI